MSIDQLLVKVKDRYFQVRYKHSIFYSKIKIKIEKINHYIKIFYYTLNSNVSIFSKNIGTSCSFLNKILQQLILSKTISSFC
jgi:hypothetical protein